jgi:Zn-dependent M28 family amino/carboxypeptidase
MKYLLTIFGLTLLSSCAYREVVKPSAKESLMTVDSLAFEDRLVSLSSDAFMGRMPFTPGGKKTIAYLEAQLKEMGLEPGHEGSFRQDVPLVEITGTPSNHLVFSVEDMEILFDLREDFMIHSERAVDRVDLNDSELVFCGYGIVAPEFGWNDYEGIDMKGKTAVVLVNDPGLGGEDPDFFKGDIMTYYGRWTYKYEEADRQGAAGLLLIHEPRMAGYPWSVVSNSWSGAQLHLDEPVDEDDCGIKGWIHLDRAKELMGYCGHDLSKLIKMARTPGFRPIPLPATVRGFVVNEIERNVSANVVAVKKGKMRPEETIVMTAHWDHLGIGTKVEGDSIYNGALDNASGTALLLSIAEQVAKTEWDRSVVFAFVTAEEQGLLGAQWYVEHPSFPLEKTVANLNIDGINWIGPSKDLTITGKGHSDMDDIAEAVASIQGRYTQMEAKPEVGGFFRSDHFCFAKKGIPALYAKGGNDHKSMGKDYAKEQNEAYTLDHYHQPSDEYKRGQWDLRGAMEDGQLFLEVAKRLANSKKWPEWEASSAFKASDKRQMD